VIAISIPEERFGVPTRALALEKPRSYNGSGSRQGHIYGRIHAPASAFVGLSYQNPPGGEKTCLNTKLASAEITVQRRGRPSRTLITRHRAAFEILTDRADHGVPIVV